MSQNKQERLNQLSNKLGSKTLSSIGLMSPSQIKMHLGEELSSEEVTELHEAGKIAHNDALIFEKKVLTRTSPLLPKLIRDNLKGGDIAPQEYDEWFGGRSEKYVAPGDVASMFSPAAYLTTLYREARGMYPAADDFHIDKRRPDLQALELSNENLNTTVSALSLSNDILLKKNRATMEVERDEDVYNKLAVDKGNINTPYHHHHNRFRQTINLKDQALEHLQRAPDIMSCMESEFLAGLKYDISPALVNLLKDNITESNAYTKFKEYFAGITPAALMEPKRLRDWFKLSDTEMHELVPELANPTGNNYSKFKDGPFYIYTAAVEGQILQIYNLRDDTTSKIQRCELYPLGSGQWKVTFYWDSTSSDYKKVTLKFNGSIKTVIESPEPFVRGKAYSGTFDWPELSLMSDSSPIIRLDAHRISNDALDALSFMYSIKVDRTSYVLLQINKLIRLYKATGLSRSELKQITESAGTLEFTDEKMSLLLHCGMLSDRFGIPNEEAICAGRGPISLLTSGDKLSQWDRLFNSPVLTDGALYPGDVKINPSQEAINEDVAIKAALKRAFQTDDEGLSYFATIYGNPTSLPLDLNSISDMYTLSVWARVLCISPAMLKQLLEMSGSLTSFKDKSAAEWNGRFQEACAIMDWLKASNITLNDMIMMLRNVTDIPTGTDITNLINDIQSALKNAELTTAATTDQYIQVIKPLLTSNFALANDTASEALMNWADRAKPGNVTLKEFCVNLITGTSTTKTNVAFAYGMAQMSLIIHATGVPSDALALFVKKPEKLAVYASEGTGNSKTLKRSADVVISLAQFSRWLKTLPDVQGAGGASISLLSSESIGISMLSALTGWTTQVTAQALNVAKASGLVPYQNLVSSFHEINVVQQIISLCETYGIFPTVLGQMMTLAKLKAGDTSPEGLAQWGKMADALAASLSPEGTLSLAQATESLLSHALGGYLCTYMSKGSAEELNQHLLLDSLNGPQVQTSRIAEAITALQLFIHRTLAEPENKSGLIKTALDRQFFKDWTRWNSRYATWAAGQQLTYYPENYIDPTQRLGQTKAMDDMLQALGQSQINEDTVGDAFNGYLHAFEEIADLETISGFHNSRDLDSGLIYFVGRSRAEPREYWWRTVDVSKRGETGLLPANAWTAWTKINVAAQVAGRMIRPVIYRDRLYISWVERQEVVTARDDKGKPTSKFAQWTLKLSWLRYDGNWSSPVSYPLSPQNDIDAIYSGGSIDDLALFMVSWPTRNCMLSAIYSRKDPQVSKTSKGLEIYEDLSSEEYDGTIAYLLTDAKNWLDTSKTTSVNAVFEGKVPYADNKITVKSGSLLPAGYKTFDAELISASLTDVPSNLSSYRLKIDLKHNVEISPTTGITQYLRELYEIYPELENVNYKVNVVTSSYGVAVIVGQMGHFNVYLITESIYADIMTALRCDTAKIEVAVSQRVMNGVKYCYTRVQGYLSTSFDNYDWTRAPLEYKSAVSNTWSDTDIRGFIGGVCTNTTLIPSQYKRESIIVPGSEVKLWLSSSAGSYNGNWSKTGNFDLSNGPVSVLWNVQSNSEPMFTDQSVIHKIKLQFGANIIREYELKVFRTQGQLKVALIGNEDSGAQYLARGGWLTRLNTLFARELTSRAASGIDTVMNWDTQHIPEPELGVNTLLTLPKYNASFHGTNKRAEIWLTTSVGARQRIWSGELKTDQKVVARVLFPKTATFDLERNYHLEMKYQRMHHTVENQQSIIINADTLTIVRSSDTGNPKLSKDIVDQVVVETKADSVLDFSGANALYFWELFYYTPMMVMQRFLQEERFDKAEHWLQYIFNPAGYTSHGQYTSRMWNVRPLAEDTSWNTEPLGSRDPDAVAQNDPMHYKLNAYMRLLDISIGRGDAAYRKGERDSMNEARTWYQRALRLLGDAPWSSSSSSWSNPSLKVTASDTALVAHMDALSQMSKGVRFADVMSLEEVAPLATDTMFLPEVNSMMIGYWEALRVRLYNLRHNLTLDGQPLYLPLYATPADPKALMRQAIAAEAGGESELPEMNYVPAMRFTPLLDSARNMVSQLIQFGNSLHQIIESGDNYEIARLLNAQGAELAAASVTAQKNTLKELAAEQNTLKKNLKAVTLRRDHYRELYQENMTSRETKAMNLNTQSLVIKSSIKPMYVSAAVSGMAPNVFGLANGGMKYGGMFNALGLGMEILSDAMAAHSNIISREEEFRRRRQEWKIRYTEADKEMETIQSQVEGINIRMQSAQMQIELMDMQSANAQKMAEMQDGRFTGKALYSWMRARLSSIYYTYYDLTVSRCMMAEKALQWEKGDSQIYMRSGTWHGGMAGLLCGEGLMLALGQMEHAWMKWQKRELEVTRRVSLAKLFEGKLKSGTTPLTLNEAMKILTSKGTVAVDGLALSGMRHESNNVVVQFGLKELGLLAGVETNKVCRIRSIGVSLPALLGPYQDVHARLSTNSTGLPVGCHESALSHGMADRGQFAADGDSHVRLGAQWLPFEGLPIGTAQGSDTRVFTLQFDDATGSQKSLLESLSDIILHVEYTAR